MVREDLLAEIDETLDQLIENASSIQTISLKQLEVSELKALQRTQESLLARLVHRDFLIKKQKPTNSSNLQKKIRHWSRLQRRFVTQVETELKKKI